MTAKRHPLHEDLLAFFSTTVLVSLGVHLLSSVGLITGGLAGMALLLADISPWGFGLCFALLNLPFYVLALLELGWRFTLNTIICVLLVATLSEWIHLLVALDTVQPAFRRHCRRRADRLWHADRVSPPGQPGRRGHPGLLPAKPLWLAGGLCAACRGPDHPRRRGPPCCRCRCWR